MFDVALALGIPDPDILLETMPWTTYVEWQFYLSNGPTWLRVLDVHLARIETVLINVNRDATKQPNPIEVDEMRIYKHYQSPEDKAQELMNKVIMLNQLMGGSLNDQRTDDGGPN